MGDLAPMIAKLRALGTMLPDAAPEIAQAVERELGAQVASGLGPDGTPLRPTKDGRQPLVNAARAIRVRAIGTVIVTKVEGHHALHHLGRARGGVRRPLIPTEGTPAPVARAIKKTLDARFAQTTGGR